MNATFTAFTPLWSFIFVTGCVCEDSPHAAKDPVSGAREYHRQDTTDLVPATVDIQEMHLVHKCQTARGQHQCGPTEHNMQNGTFNVNPFFMI
jgi:hypothetical protein